MTSATHTQIAKMPERANAKWLADMLLAAGVQAEVVTVTVDDFDNDDNWGPGHYVVTDSATAAKWRDAKQTAPRDSVASHYGYLVAAVA